MIGCLIPRNYQEWIEDLIPRGVQLFHRSSTQNKQTSCIYAVVGFSSWQRQTMCDMHYLLLSSMAWQMTLSSVQIWSVFYLFTERSYTSLLLLLLLLLLPLLLLILSHYKYCCTYCTRTNLSLLTADCQTSVTLSPVGSHLIASGTSPPAVIVPLEWPSICCEPRYDAFR